MKRPAHIQNLDEDRDLTSGFSAPSPAQVFAQSGRRSPCGLIPARQREGPASECGPASAGFAPVPPGRYFWVRFLLCHLSPPQTRLHRGGECICAVCSCAGEALVGGQEILQGPFTGAGRCRCGLEFTGLIRVNICPFLARLSILPSTFPWFPSPY